MQSREQIFHSGNSKKEKRNKKNIHSHNNDIKAIQSDLKKKGRVQFFLWSKKHHFNLNAIITLNRSRKAHDDCCDDLN